jgi:hypothetical protein
VKKAATKNDRGIKRVGRKNVCDQCHSLCDFNVLAKPTALTTIIYPALDKLSDTDDVSLIAALEQLKSTFDKAERLQPGMTSNNFSLSLRFRNFSCIDCSNHRYFKEVCTVVLLRSTYICCCKFNDISLF